MKKSKIGEVNWGCFKRLKMDIKVKQSKQELYFVKENYEIFSTEVSAREKQG